MHTSPAAGCIKCLRVDFLVATEHRGVKGVNCAYMDLVHLLSFCSVKMLLSKYTCSSCSDTSYFKSTGNCHVMIPPPQKISTAVFTFVMCKFKLVQSSAAPGLSVLHLMGRCYRLTNVVKAAVRRSLCFPRASCDPHLITDSILHIFFSYDTPPLARFHFFLLHKGFTTVPALHSSFLACLSDVLI